MDKKEDKKADKKLEPKENVKVEKVETKKSKDPKKAPEAKKEEPKFQQATKKEADKVNKEQKKENKKAKGTKTRSKRPWIPTAIIAAVVIAVIAILTVMIIISSDPKKALDGLLTNLKSGNFEKAQEYLAGEDTELTSTSLDEETQKLLFEKLVWNIKKVTQENDKATIEVEIKNKDFQTVVNNYAKRALNAAKEAIANGNTQPISEQDFQKYFLEELKNEDIKPTTSTKTINAIKIDKKWKVVSDDALVSAILPGLEETLNALS